MVIVMERHTAETNIERVMSELIARGFDDEGAVEAVRAADTADRNEIGHGFYSLTISS